MQWPGWQRDVAALAPEEAFAFYPPLFTQPGMTLTARERRALPLIEVVTLGWKTAASLARPGER